jgi:hypothetical protein
MEPSSKLFGTSHCRVTFHILYSYLEGGGGWRKSRQNPRDIEHSGLTELPRFDKDSDNHIRRIFCPLEIGGFCVHIIRRFSSNTWAFLQRKLHRESE